MEIYKKIINAFLDGTVEGIEEHGIIPEHIETTISHVFLFPKTVYKICKQDNFFFNTYFRNVADKHIRFDFYRADFFENNYFSPEVYRELYGVRLEGDSIVLNTDLENTDDIVMRMNRLDSTLNLSHLLHEKTLTETDFQSMGFQQTKAVALFPAQPISAERYSIIFQRRFDDLKNWMYSAPTYFFHSETDRIILALRTYLDKNNTYFDNIDSKSYVISLDNHSDNIFYKDGIMRFLDIYPPKEDWMTVVPWINIYRPATDIFLLQSESSARAFIQGYKDYYGSLDEQHELFYFIYSAAMQGVSLHNQSANNPRKKEDSIFYKKFVLENINKLDL